MKKITILTILIAATFNIAAQDAYYYSGSEKIPLTKVPDKKVIISLKNNTRAAMGVDSTAQIIEDHALDIAVVNNAAKSAQTANSDNILAQDICYIDGTGLELAPTGYFYIKLKQQEDYSVLVNVASQFGLEIANQNMYMPLWYSLRINSQVEGSIIDIANRISETRLFAACSPAFSFNAVELSYDPQVNQQWGLFNAENPLADISISEAWSFATGRDVKIAIIDFGVDVNHQDLKDNILMSFDFHTNSSPSIDYHEKGHGTHCAGVAAASRNNGLNIAGVAPDAKILAAGVNNSGANPLEQLSNAINWSWQNGADILSCSWNCNPDTIREDAIDYAMSNGRNGKGSLIIKSAGNERVITYPGTYRNDIIVVGAIDDAGNLYSMSGRGPELDICAPGVNILSTNPGNQTRVLTGTSMACPHISGVVALMLERNPNLTINQVQQILAETAVKTGNLDYNLEGEFGLRNNHFGYGLVNAHQAVINTPRE